MSPASCADAGQRVLVFAPVGRDAELTDELLSRATIACTVCMSITELVDRLEAEGAGAVLLTEEVLHDPRLGALEAALNEQPAWSDIPILLFAGGPGSEADPSSVRSLDALRNVTLMDRPIRVTAVLSTVRAALRSRARQYEVRDLLIALHRARSDAEHSNRLKDEFLATLSHELRTPLNAILGWTSMLVRGQIEPKMLPHVFGVLDRNAQSQVQLIGDILDVSRIITGKLTLETKTVDLGEVVARAIDVVRPAAEAKQITITIPEAQSYRVFGDVNRLQQVFWNLLNNAIKFTPPRGSIDVTLERNGGRLTVAVTDSGVGIKPEFVPFVFDRFRQGDQTMTRTHGGLGLGLSIVKYLVELHGGTVSASSEGSGRGARFEVQLPAIDASDRRPALVAGSDGAADALLDDCFILVVDDDESTREVLTASLEAARARVQVAASASEARGCLARQTPSLIVADLGMPGEDGYTFIRGVRQSSAREIPAIALSAYADPRSRDAALAAGFTAFLAKPARPEALVDLIASLLGPAQRL